MTKIEFNIADDLARRAEAAGLLTQTQLEESLRFQLRKAAGEKLLATMKAAHAISGPEMPLEEINALVKEVRQERRQREAAGR
jgi:hypothetical protein